MNYKEIQLENFTVAGISIRTSNQDGRAMRDIGELWNTFFATQVAASIPNKLSDDVYCIYTDYESDFTGEYTTILGCKIANTDSIPAGLVTKEIAANNYHQYTSIGKLPDCVGETWMTIWKEGTNINRAYAADFDVYTKESHDPMNATVTTYLSVK